MTQVQLPPIHVAMIAFNGEEFLPAQLNSLAAQSKLPTSVWISDDGSEDRTVDMVGSFQRHAPFPVHLFQGPRCGAAANMAKLIRMMPAENIATCDQDDIWLPDRLRHAAMMLAAHNKRRPAIHVCTRSGAGWQPRKNTDHSFANALVENRAPGNASAFNRAAVRLLQGQAHRLTQHTPFFDWWAYQIILGVGGEVLEDRRRGLIYRAHRSNILGPRWSLRGLSARARALANGTYKRWLLDQATTLSHSQDALLPAHYATLRQFLFAAESHGPLGPVHRISPLEQICLKAAWRLPIAEKHYN